MKSLLAAIARFITGANARWIGSAPETRQRIYFANHTSHLDTLVIWASLPPQIRDLTRPVGARDYWMKTKLRSYVAHEVFNALLIERKKPTAHDNPLADMRQALDGGIRSLFSRKAPGKAAQKWPRSKAAFFTWPRIVPESN